VYYALLGAHADRVLIGAWKPMLCPIWGFRLDRQKCEDIIRRAVDGTYVCRESSSGDKYIICLKHGSVVKNFQVYIKGVRQLLAFGLHFSAVFGLNIRVLSRLPLLDLAFWTQYPCAFAALHHLHACRNGMLYVVFPADLGC